LFLYKEDSAAAIAVGTDGEAAAAVKQYLRRQLQAQPDLTLAELGQRLDESMHVQFSKSRLWDVLQGLGLRRKKTAARQ